MICVLLTMMTTLQMVVRVAELWICRISKSLPALSVFSIVQDCRDSALPCEPVKIGPVKHLIGDKTGSNSLRHTPSLNIKQLNFEKL